METADVDLELTPDALRPPLAADGARSRVVFIKHNYPLYNRNGAKDLVLEHEIYGLAGLWWWAIGVRAPR